MALIHEKLALINKEIGVIEKNQRNQQQGFNYRGVEDVLNSLHDILAKHDVFVLPSVVSPLTREERPTRSGGVNVWSICDYAFKFVTSDSSSETCIVRGEAMDSGDKGLNKVLSVAYKYAMFITFTIPTKELIDPDSDSHDPKPKTEVKTPTKEAQKPLLTPQSEDWSKVVEWLSKDGNTIGKVESKRTICIDDRNQLIKEASELTKANKK